MGATEPDVTTIRAAVRAALGGDGRIVLAVSGGIDSMVLLDAAAAVLERERLVVATFDHATGAAATHAAAAVAKRCQELGVACARGRATHMLRSEAELRDARWDFLHDVARRHEAGVATAHTRDDQIETVLMRVMRGAGARGLAGLYAPSAVRRPLVRVARAQIEAYARSRGLRWTDDPSNASRAYLRNRVRLDLLPALLRTSPSVADHLLAVADRAAAWRRDVHSVVEALVQVDQYDDATRLDVPAEPLVAQSGDALAWLWPAIVERAGIVLDRRAIARLAGFTHRGRVGSRIQLAGGWEVVRARAAFEVRRVMESDAATAPTVAPLLLSNETSWGDWAFQPLDRLTEAAADRQAGAWTAWLPADEPLTVRPWRPGDTMRVRAGGSARKIKRLLSEAGVTGHRREGWPVVLAGHQIVWLPGVCRSVIATALSGRGGLPFRCEYLIQPRVRRPAPVGAKSPSDRL